MRLSPWNLLTVQRCEEYGLSEEVVDMQGLVILAGPSCVGKGPLIAAFKTFHPRLAAELEPLVLYNSRSPRPGERNGVDYHFRSRETIEHMGKRKDFHVFEVRGDLQGLDAGELKTTLRTKRLLFEGNPFVGEQLLSLATEEEISVTCAFLSPFCLEEIRFLSSPESGVNLQKFVTDVMRRKLLRRMQRQKGILSLPDLEEVERRAGSALKEICLAPRFGNVIPNHDGEDSEHWNAFPYPLGDARKALAAFTALLKGEESPFIERWDETLPLPLHS